MGKERVEERREKTLVETVPTRVCCPHKVEKMDWQGEKRGPFPAEGAAHA